MEKEKNEKEKSEKEKSERARALEDALARIEKSFGKDSIMKLGEKISKIEVEVVPTGILPLDIALGVGGIPRGRVIEIYGPEASGKTGLALIMASQIQKQNGTVAFIDAEHALDIKYAERLGVKVEDLLVSQPDSGEQALNIAETLVRSNAVDMIIVDSVAALVPEAEIKGEIGEQTIAMQARLMSQAMRKLTSAIAKSKTIVIFINQIRYKIGVMFGSPETTTGGLALKFYASIRLEVRRGEKIVKGEEQIGSKIIVKVTKNKVAPPFKSCTFDFLFNEGVIKEGCVLDQAEMDEIISRSGAWYTYKGEKFAQGRDKAIEYLRQTPKLLSELEKLIREKHFGKQQKETTKK